MAKYQPGFKSPEETSETKDQAMEVLKAKLSTSLNLSEFDKSKWGCPKCGWPLNPKDNMGDGGVTCSCGVWVPLPEQG